MHIDYIWNKPEGENSERNLF